MRQLLVFLLMLPFCAHAQIEAIGVHLVSRHDPYHGENQFNPGLFLRLQHNIVVGQYTNSLQQQTNYVGIATPEWYRTRISLLAATGYKKKGGVIVPIPSFKLYQFDDGPSLWMAGVPIQITDSRAVGHLYLEWKIK